MLFLAVLCGFLAELELEHKIEKKREKVYMKSLLADLRKDTSLYTAFVTSNKGVYIMIDSLILYMGDPDRQLHINKLYYWSRMISIKLKFLFPVERTYEEMKSSGYLRLIRSGPVADSVSHYYNSLISLYKYNDVGLEWAADYVRSTGKIFDAGIHFKILKEGKEQNAETIGFLTKDPITINELLSSAQYIYGALRQAEGVVVKRNQTAQTLIELITKKYHLE